ncbi:MAG: LytTR family transcriptional regulator, partial [Gammaproteobacteria bacterium]|nr:LytTR family transcriptional regulator [Gammaproteobacteria bacterium]
FLAEHKYVTVGYVEGEVLIEDSLLTLEKRFPQHFMRIHRNALVAIDHIAALEKDNQGRCHIRLKDCDKVLEVSRRHLPTIRKFMKR